MHFLHLLTIVFITLKLVGVIVWSWWLVLLPLIAEVVLLVVIFALAFIGAVIKAR